MLGEGRLLDDALAESRDLATLQPRDRAFVRVLAATTLRRLGQIDGLVDHCLDRPLKAKQAEVKTLLRLGACQLMFLDTPAHAAVDSTVALARGAALGGYRGLVNAVLRRLTREGAAIRDGQDPATGP